MMRTIHFLIALFLSAAVTVGDSGYMSDGRLDYGTDHLDIPPAVEVNITRPRTVALLAEEIRRAAAPRRVQLVAEIGSCGLTEGVQPLRRAMDDSDPGVRTAAVRAAAQLGNEELLADVQGRLEDADPQVRRAAVTAFAAIDQGRTRPSPAVEAGISDDDPQVQIAAARAAASHDDARLLLDDLDRFSPGVQVEAIASLGRLEADFAAEAVARHLAGPIQHRAAAARSLGQMRGEDQQEQVLAALADEHPTVRREAVAALVGVAPVALRQQRAILMLQDPDPTVRQAAADVLALDVPREAIEPLLAQLPYAYVPLHHAAREALISAPRDLWDDIIIAAVALLDHADPRRQEDGSYILGTFRSDAGLSRHIELLDVTHAETPQIDWALIAQAARSLGRIGDASAAPHLAEVARMAHRLQRLHAPQAPTLPGPDQAIGEAIIAAGRLGYDPLLPDVKQIFRGSPETQPGFMRSAAIWAAGVLGEAGDPDISTGQFISSYHNIFESEMAKVESLKAIGNLGLRDGARPLETIMTEDFGTRTRWMAHWSYTRITGDDREYIPPTMHRAADVSIIDITPRQ